MPQTEAVSSALDRPQLIALNAGELSRAAICRLARSPEPWWRSAKTSKVADATACGVTRAELAAARTALENADDIVDRELRLAEVRAVQIITLPDSDYPPPLLELELPPPVLYIRGSLPPRPCLSIVGARRATGYGLDTAAALAADLSERGLTIVSGFARGIDAAAHRAAARASDGRTVAILGCGLDIDYPRGRDRLREEISAAGALVSEFPFGTAPLRQNFPVRNRIIAALGHGTLVVEATARSGSLITARLALELGRDVYAVPGRIFDDKAVGPNTLIRDGAFLVQHPRDILETLPQHVCRQLISEPEAGASAAEQQPRLPTDQQTLLRLLPAGERKSVDDLVRDSGLEVERITGLLLELELAGWVRRHPGPAYARAEIW
jgi:DNA processing protein